MKRNDKMMPLLLGLKIKEDAYYRIKCQLIEVSWHDTQRPRIGDGWAIYNFLLERLPSK
jgi:hypothetical protein